MHIRVYVYIHVHVLWLLQRAEYVWDCIAVLGTVVAAMR